MKVFEPALLILISSGWPSLTSPGFWKYWVPIKTCLKNFSFMKNLSSYSALTESRWVFISSAYSWCRFEYLVSQKLIAIKRKIGPMPNYMRLKGLQKKTWFLRDSLARDKYDSGILNLQIRLNKIIYLTFTRSRAKDWSVRNNKNICAKSIIPQKFLRKIVSNAWSIFYSKS